MPDDALHADSAETELPVPVPSSDGDCQKNTILSLQNQIGKTTVPDKIISGAADSDRLTGAFQYAVGDDQILQNYPIGVRVPRMAGANHQRIVSGGDPAVGYHEVPTAEEMNSIIVDHSRIPEDFHSTDDEIAALDEPHGPAR